MSIARQQIAARKCRVDAACAMHFETSLAPLLALRRAAVNY